tara:strand:+ start:669 stop:1313 length:645 start_codon:yes stop_codon:yes gene_type:complete
MDEETTLIDTKTRNERLKSFFIKNKKLLISLSIFLILILFSFYTYSIYKDGHREWLANKYNKAVIEYENGEKLKVISSMKEVIKDKNTTYSPLALYFLLDNNLIENKDMVNRLFDILIQDTNLEREIKNLVIYKKGLFNSNKINESELMEILKPIINSQSIWKSHTLYLLAEYFYSKKEKEKSKEFFKEIISLENSNMNIKAEAQKRINRDFGE